MSVNSDALPRHLPYLRRYARALAGSQERGDHYVRLCLETLLQEPDLLEAGRKPRVQLYKLFHQVWSRIARQTDPVPHDDSLAPLFGYMQELPSQERQLLLLTAVEGFSVPDAADILGIDVPNAMTLLDAGRRKLSEQTESTVLVIEDEPIIAFDIIEIVKEMGHRTVGIATTKREAVDMANTLKPGVVLADIKLGDGSSGIDAVGEILQSMTVPVIFVTAYPERLLTGERKEPVYLVTKPFESDELKVSIYHALLASGPPASLHAAS